MITQKTLDQVDESIKSFNDTMALARKELDDCIAYALKNGIKVELPLFDPPTFSRKDYQVWKIRNGWMLARSVNKFFVGHTMFHDLDLALKTLKEAV